MAEAKTKTALFGNKQKGGLLAIEDQSLSTGNRWFVDSGKTTAGADSAGKGRSPIAPFLTLDYAESQATASNDDRIYLMAGHVESITTPITLTKAGITIIGLGKGDARPTFTAISNATATVTVTGADSSISNCRFVCNIADQTEAIDIAADDFELDSCELIEGSAVPLGLITAGTADADSDGLNIHDCVLRVPTAGNGNQAIEITKDLANVTIANNIIYGDFDEACIQIPAAGNACTNIRIVDNELSNLLTGQHAVQINGTAVTGLVARNLTQTDTQADTLDTSACARYLNYWIDVDGTNQEEGILVDAPIAGSGPTADVAAILVDTGTTLPASLASQDVARGGMVRKTVDFAVGVGTGSIGTVALFTVTGAVKFSIIATCSDTLVGAATLECGVSGTTAGIIAQIADSTDLITGEIWADATPTLKLDTLANSQLDFVIGDGADIFLTIGAANQTDGTIDFNIIWIPLSATGNIVAA